MEKVVQRRREGKFFAMKYAENGHQNLVVKGKAPFGNDQEENGKIKKNGPSSLWSLKIDPYFENLVWWTFDDVTGCENYFMPLFISSF